MMKNEAEAIRSLLQSIGEDPDREGLKDTPNRIIRMWREIFRGYDKEQAPKITTFSNDEQSTDIIMDSGEYYSMCEHHILPFFGEYYLAYKPSPQGRIIGLSKIARVVGYCSARLQLQERLAKDIVTMLNDALDGDVQGFAILLRGQHMCKSMRGVKAKGWMTTTYFTGCFRDVESKKEFYKLIEYGKRT